jgi:hypothetical protein
MKALILILSLLTANLCFAAQLTVVNKTKEIARIEKLSNRCQSEQVPDGKPIFLQPEEAVVFNNLKPVVQIYTICGSGFCSSSAMGMKKGQASYTLEIIIKDELLDSQSKPDHWSTTNIECPK